MTEEDFWASASPVGECWIWQRPPTHGGYGQVLFRGKVRRAHRAAYEITNGTIPLGMCICHQCDTRLCIRPDHLFLGTRADNNQDMFNKGRGHKFDGTQMVGERNCNAKLTAETAIEARELRKSGVDLQEIADRFAVTKQAIWLCVHGKTWKSIPL